MYGEMLRDGMVPSEAKRDEYYRHITVESERLSRLINNVLEFSRLEKGTREMALAIGAVAPVVREVAELLRPHVERAGVRAARRRSTTICRRCASSATRCMQVLWNLVDNAVKYARGAAPRRDRAALLARRRTACTSPCAITARASPPRHLGKIFEPFYRGESELTRRSKGTGLGLALVRGLVERMGATVRGRNAADGGFEVEIGLVAAAG